MSFKVDWNLLETASMSEWTKTLLTETLNSGKRPNILASDIEIKDLNFGKIPPSFEILEIGELEKDRLRGIFKIHYDGDAHITLHTKVQANPLKIYSDNLHELENHTGGSSDFISPAFLLSNEQFSLPLDLKLSDIKLAGIGVIVFSKTKGLTLVFRNDPLESIKVSSTFDVVQVLAKFLQKQIENQIRELFRETLPTVLHRLSLKYISLNGDSFDLNNLTRTEEVANDIALFDLNSDINYSVKNLQKNLQLFNSRETLDVNVPKFRNLIQRCDFERYNRNLSPNLLTSLNLLNSNSADGQVGSNDGSSNGIPISFIVDKDPNSLEKLLRNISNVQSNSFYKITTSGNLSKPKRRVVKLGKNKSKSKNQSRPADEEAANSTIVSEGENASEYLEGSTSDSTLIEDSVSCDKTNDPIAQPAPKRLGETKLIQSHSHFHRNFYNTSPNNSNSSLLSGVGIGNNYFNFTRKDHITYSPEAETPTRVKTKKSLNHLDMKVIKDKLEEIKRLDGKGQHLGHAFDTLPPPPYKA